MRFLTDQDVYASTVHLLRDLGHDTLTATEAGLSATTDTKLLEFVRGQNRLLITRDGISAPWYFSSNSARGSSIFAWLPAMWSGCTLNSAASSRPMTRRS